jgi:hypothetical protein
VKIQEVPPGVSQWRDRYLSFALSKGLKKRLPSNQCDVIFVLSHDPELGLMGHFYTYRIAGGKDVCFLTRNAVNILINKKLVSRSAARRSLPILTDAGRALVNDVAGFDATRSLDLPSDVPLVSHRGFARSFTSMSEDHLFRFLVAVQRVVESFPDAVLRSDTRGINMVAARDRDFDTGEVISEFCYDVRVYYDTINYRVIKSSDLRAAALAADVCRIAFRPLKSSKRRIALPDEFGFNFHIEVVKAALVDEHVQVCLRAILKVMDPSFTELLLQYPPPAAPTKPTYSELEAEVARLTKLLASATV